jgi:hypothetical protein
MELKGIISISGKSGLFKMVGQTKSGIIVESLEDGKRFPAYAAHKVSALEDISIYGYNEDRPLADIYEAIYKHEDGGKSVSANASVQDQRDKLLEVFPEYDEDRVYSSDLKKLFKWYNMLVDNGFLKEAIENADEDSKEDKSDEEE